MSDASDEFLKAGIAGAGVFGRYHAQKYEAAHGARVSAVYDRDPARAAALAADFGAAVFDDFAAFVAAVDLMSVTAPATAHFSLAKQALTAGRHCLVEKPLSMSARESAELIDAAEAVGAVLQVGHQERFICDAFGLFDSPTPPQASEFVRCGPRSGRCEDVCVVFDLMIHDLDLVNQLGLGAPLAVIAFGDDNETVARLVFDGERTVNLKASRQAATPERRLHLIYGDGEGDDERKFDFLTRTRTDRREGQSTDIRASDLAAGGGDIVAALDDPLGFGVSRFVATVRQCVAGERTPPPITGAAGAAAVALAERIVAERIVAERNVAVNSVAGSNAKASRPAADSPTRNAASVERMLAR